MEKDLRDFFFLQYSQPASLILASEVQSEGSIINEPEINAKAALSVRINTNGEEQVLFEKNPSQVLPIASLTKLVTAWIVFEYPKYYDFSQKIKVSENAISQEGDFGLQKGQAVSIKDLLYSMLTESSNDAAFALAEALAPDSDVNSKEKAEAFVALMNLEAKEKLDLKNTHFVNPTGLESKTEGGNPLTNYSTIEDLVKLAKNIFSRHPEIFEVSNQKSALIFGNYLAINKNEILSENTIGGKTGWTPAAGGCILLVLKDDKARIINIILGTASPEARFIEMQKLIKFVKREA